MPRYLYVDFNSYFASCEQQKNPALRGKPIIVVPMLADSTCAIAASYEAKAFGIKTGTMVGEAKKMCPGLIIVSCGGHGDYVKYHHKAIEIIDTVLPVTQVCSIDEICCYLSGSHSQEDRAIELSHEIKKRLAKNLGECLTVSIGLGPNRLLAKMAADMQKPNGLTLLRNTELVEKLSPLAVNDIPGVGRKMYERLKAHQIKTIGDLLKKSEGELRAIWGSILGVRLYHSLRGMDLRSHMESGKSIGHQHVLPPQKRSRDGAFLTLEKLLIKAATRLRKAEKMTQTMYISIRYLNQSKWKQEVRFSPTQSTQELIRILTESLKNNFIREKPIKVSVTLGNFSSASEGEQMSFFTDYRKEHLSKVIDDINTKFGRDTVSVASQLADKKAAPTLVAFSRIPDLDEVD